MKQSRTYQSRNTQLHQITPNLYQNISNYIKVISNVICILYFREFEVFDKDLIHSDLEVDDEFKIITNPKRSYYLNAFGINIAVKGRKYHWRLKIECDGEEDDPYINIGIIEADKAKQSLLAHNDIGGRKIMDIHISKQDLFGIMLCGPPQQMIFLIYGWI